jgi:hypothetical protein
VTIHEEFLQIIAYLVAGDLIGLLLTKIALNKIGTVAISSTVTYKAVGALALIYSDLVLLGSANAETGVTISVHRHDSMLGFVGTLWNGAKWIATSLKHQEK